MGLSVTSLSVSSPDDSHCINIFCLPPILSRLVHVLFYRLLSPAFYSILGCLPSFGIFPFLLLPFSLLLDAIFGLFLFNTQLLVETVGA